MIMYIENAVHICCKYEYHLGVIALHIYAYVDE
jgi:hypothetical protein